jgi:hypothetical protein
MTRDVPCKWHRIGDDNMTLGFHTRSRRALSLRVAGPEDEDDDEAPCERYRATPDCFSRKMVTKAISAGVIPLIRPA